MSSFKSHCIPKEISVNKVHLENSQHDLETYAFLTNKYITLRIQQGAPRYSVARKHSPATNPTALKMGILTSIKEDPSNGI